jgi:peptide/nickel transport system ATP-binding protein
MPLLSVSDLHVHYSLPGGVLRAVDGVTFHIERGETVGLVGESGCGKSTLGRTVLRLEKPAGGSIRFDGTDISSLPQAALRPLRRRMQMVFQDPFASLNPRHLVGDILDAPFAIHGPHGRGERLRRVHELLDRVGLPRSVLGRYPHEFSGGQRQRVGIARALMLAPELVVCDEPVSALDLSIQAQILNLLASLKADFKLSYLFISHDLSVMRYFADRVLVMYLGRIVEVGTAGQVWSEPRHPYTRALMDAVPDPARRRPPAQLLGDLPDPMDLPPGCGFRPRCPRASALCASQAPALTQVAPDHQIACHHRLETASGAGASAPLRFMPAAYAPATPRQNAIAGACAGDLRA